MLGELGLLGDLGRCAGQLAGVAGHLLDGTVDAGHELIEAAGYLGQLILALDLGPAVQGQMGRRFADMVLQEADPASQAGEDLAGDQQGDEDGGHYDGDHLVAAAAVTLLAQLVPVPGLGDEAVEQGIGPLAHLAIGLAVTVAIEGAGHLHLIVLQGLQHGGQFVTLHPLELAEQAFCLGPGGGIDLGRHRLLHGLAHLGNVFLAGLLDPGQHPLIIPQRGVLQQHHVYADPHARDAGGDLRHGAHGGGRVLVELIGLQLDVAHAAQAGAADQQEGDARHCDGQDELGFQGDLSCKHDGSLMCCYVANVAACHDDLPSWPDRHSLPVRSKKSAEALSHVTAGSCPPADPARRRAVAGCGSRR